ncbi:thiolase family protein [Dethiosulfatarculus sandiegensis]|uniref:Acetyl-CoA acetyltransferase n=1 Tax=Dethiosulfatarculus sandiegensis TaxID=1429043 RepID=A0A0D2IYN1_9BACT|nr:thiolase family protein [Dethiosulfatarculus sandiegensis]KIX11134.1 acetyl-CoA acetyltransferase [Dethiosulfatarculus sandiegensis]
MKKIAITAGVRTPIGKYLGALREVPAHELGALVLNQVVERAQVKPAQVDDVVMGQSYQNGESVNIARMSLLAAGWPVEIPGVTLDRRCLSGLDAVCFGAMKIMSDCAEIVAAGGVESMSRAEFYIPGEFIKWGAGGKKDPKWGFMPRGHGALGMWGLPLFDRIQRARVMSQPVERFGELNSMMTWAEAAAREENITREQADNWAMLSQQKALKAIEQGKFKEETVRVPLPPGKNTPDTLNDDEPPRKGVTTEKLAKLATVYPDGICTAGNSSTENDGAAALLLMPVEKVSECGVEPLGEIVSFAVAAADPRLTYPAVPASVEKALAKAGLGIKDIDLIEIQEAFSAQVLADTKLMGLSEEEMQEKVNVNGSGISLGHPIAATGAMRLVTLLYEMKRRNASHGLVTICGGGGQGIAMVVKR